MTVQIELPQELEQRLAEGGRDPAQTLREAALIELYREGKLFHSELARLLDVSRYELDGILKARGILHNLTLEQVLEESRALKTLIKPLR